MTRFLKLPLSSIGEFSKLVQKYKNVYNKIDIPIMILHGDKDTIVPLQSSLNIYDSLEFPEYKKKIVVLKGVSHDIFREVEKDTLKKIESLLV